MVISNLSEQTSLRFLVVEDETLIAMNLEDMLMDSGHRVEAVCTSVDQALAAIATMRHRIDAVMLDANLGGQSAAPVADKLRSSGIPFILASGYEREELERIGFGDTALRKPYRESELNRAIAQLLARNSGVNR